MFIYRAPSPPHRLRLSDADSGNPGPDRITHCLSVQLMDFGISDSTQDLAMCFLAIRTGFSSDPSPNPMHGLEVSILDPAYKFCMQDPVDQGTPLGMAALVPQRGIQHLH